MANVQPTSDLGALRITRYSDFGKFAAMLYESGLYFAFPNRLGDAQEGLFGFADRDAVLPDAMRMFPDHLPVTHYIGGSQTNGIPKLTAWW